MFLYYGIHTPKWKSAETWGSDMKMVMLPGGCPTGIVTDPPEGFWQKVEKLYVVSQYLFTWRTLWIFVACNMHALVQSAVTFLVEYSIVHSVMVPHTLTARILCQLLLKPDKLSSLTSSYRTISLITSIMKLFEWVIEQMLCSYLEDIGFISKYQLGFRQAYHHLFRLSQSVMESFNRREHVMAVFLDVEKAFDNVWHNGLRYKIFMLDLPSKMTRWLSDFLVGRVIQFNVNGFLSDIISPIAGVPHGSVLSPLLFLTYINDLPNPHHRQNSKSQFADDSALWAASKNVQFAAKVLRKDLRKLAKLCAKWRKKLNPEKTEVIIFSRPPLARKSDPVLKLYGERLKFYPQVKCLGITFDSKLTFQKHFDEILGRCSTRYHRVRLMVNKKCGPTPSTILQIDNQCVRPIFQYGVHVTCPAFTKIHQCKAATWLVWPSIDER